MMENIQLTRPAMQNSLHQSSVLPSSVQACWTRFDISFTISNTNDVL